MANLYLLDSSVLIRLSRRAPYTRLRTRVDELLQADAVATCDPVRFELLRGARSEVEFSHAEAFLDSLHRLPAGTLEWSEAARLGFRLQRSGVNVGAVDILVAAVAISHQVTLLHADGDFERVRQHSPLVTEAAFDLLATS